MSEPSAGAAALPAGLSGEDAIRAVDRARVLQARRSRRRGRLVWLLVGPGILAMLGENDGPSMISYATDGASYGIGFFVPFTIVLFAMAYACQEMCMRIGSVTHRGYGELVLHRYGRAWGWFAAGDLVLTNLATLIAEFVAIRVGLAYFGLSTGVAVALGLALVGFTLAGGRYWRWERVVLGLAAFNVLFLIAGLATRPSAHAVAHALATAHPLPHGSFNTLLLLIASTIGATVTPWMIFFQQSASADKGMTPRDLPYGRLDTGLGALFAALAGIGALLAGAALFGHGGGGIQGLSGAGFPHALDAGGHSFAATVFALGLVEAGAVAILTISASTAYAAGECIGASHTFNSSFTSSSVFHLTNAGVAAAAAAVVLIPGAPLLSIALNANVLATVLAPVSLVFMVMLAADRELMGRFANHRRTTILVGAIIAFVAACGAAYGIDSFLQAVHVL
jgi:Mn2+/Fe2+ NRAMP family transporter